jgi:hypothetical protein
LSDWTTLMSHRQARPRRRECKRELTSFLWADEILFVKWVDSRFFFRWISNKCDKTKEYFRFSFDVFKWRKFWKNLKMKKSKKNKYFLHATQYWNLVIHVYSCTNIYIYIYINMIWIIFIYMRIVYVFKKL